MGIEHAPLVDGGGEVVGGGVVPPELPPQAAVSSMATERCMGPQWPALRHPADYTRGGLRRFLP